ncbi:hypothetical protein HANVADRAFT_52165 [Hanseniaspora valbyensis NRRL Y-1626]|uniref:Glucosidase II subunit alpha n=1 Tax=Hanseniaspora valbyensis NRRL Y-1626 TaxID=766949 RepID=A0A1B7TG75_9ASCO|nr:hypothetical protein HANVADRAFT_52165 [Hanseniaspora valbyensis NRRL Y-1626]
MNSEEFNKTLMNYFINVNDLQLNETGKIKGEIIKKFTHMGKNNDTNNNEGNFQSVFLPFEIQFNPQNNDNMFRFIVDEHRTRDMKRNIPDKMEIDRFRNTSEYSFNDPNWFEWDLDSDKETKGYTLEMIDLQDNEMNINNFDTNNVYGYGAEDTSSLRYLLIFPTLQPDIKIKFHLLPTFKIEVLYKDVAVLAINDENLFNFEHLRSINSRNKNISPMETDFGSFRSDSRYYTAEHKEKMFFEREAYKFGPQSIGLDFKFKNNIKQVYGIPEHPGSLKLLNTWNDTELEPYRLFNIDAFDYSHVNNDPLYGSIPFMLGVSNNCSVGIFSNNPSDTDIDIQYNQNNVLTHWITETNILDFIIFVEDSPERLLTSYTDLTGNVQLPLLSSLGYHQSRWNYESSLDLLYNNEMFKELEIPIDFFWLDIDYTEDRKYFTWLKEAFSNVTDLLVKFDEDGGKNLVAIIDPHLKTDYFISDQVIENGLAIKDSKFDNLVAECWPGDSVWLDFLDNGKAYELWHQFYENFLESATSANISNFHAWNDMNEPSLFKKFETTMQLDAIHNNGFEHRSLHNLYGLSMHETTYKSMKDIYGNVKRPFVLTRSFFAGSQKTAATWTGDNFAKWEYLENSVPMILSSGLAGMPFIGADVGGFFDNPSFDLLVRWYQLAVFYPFFRAHAHIDTTRREPHVIMEQSEYHGNLMKEAILERYQLLNYIYNEFEKSTKNGQPILKPLFWKNFNSTDSSIFDIEDQFYLADLIVKPITKPNVEQVEMILPENNDLYYNFNNYSEKFEFGIEKKEDRTVTLNVTMDSIPIFIEGGSVLFLKETPRRSSSAMRYDNFTIILAPDKKGNCKKTQIYIDDGETYEYQSTDKYIKSFISYSNGKFVVESEHSNLEEIPQYIEKIVLLGTDDLEHYKVIEDLEIPLFENTTHLL